MALDGVNGADNSGKSIQAYEGISVDLIKEKGSKADARAINIYDTDNDGYLTGTEVSVFNNTRRTLSDDGKTLTITNQQDGKNQEYKITSSSGHELDPSTNPGEWHEMAIREDRFSFFRSGDKIEGDVCGSISLGNNGRIDINLETNKVYIEGAEGTDNRVDVNSFDLTIKDSEIAEITANGGSIELDNVHDRTLFFETDTTVKLPEGNSVLNHKNSSIEVNET